jgi:predicted PurR-regulated permease PerM
MNQITKLVLEFLNSDLFSISGSMASIISLILTFYVFLDVRRIKSYYLFAGRVPELIKQLQQHAQAIFNYLDKEDRSFLEVEQELTNAEVVLESLKDKLDGELKKSVEQLLQSLKSYDRKRQKRSQEDLF